MGGAQGGGNTGKNPKPPKATERCDDNEGVKNCRYYR